MLRVFAWTLSAAIALEFVTVGSGAPFVPGTGQFLKDCCDDFENENWTYTYQHPKSSYEQDENQRAPGGRSNNGLWHEGAMRGTPDLVKRVPTPAGGLEGSTGSLLMATRLSGIPGRLSNQQQQDDLLMKFDRVLGRTISVSWQPSCLVRVYLPPFEQWENRSGPSFGMRADCIGRSGEGKNEEYWPGMFLLFKSETSRNVETDSAQLTVRAGPRGNDLRSHQIAEPGWWTLGMSFTADGQIHYYARQGVEPLTAEDHIYSGYPYGYRCMTFNNFFFNVANWDNGKNWSTPWIIDDPEVYVIPPQGQEVTNLYRRRQQPQSQANRPNMRGMNRQGMRGYRSNR